MIVGDDDEELKELYLARTMRLRIAVQIEGSWRRYDVKCDEDETVGDLVDRLLERLGCTLKEVATRVRFMVRVFF